MDRKTILLLTLFLAASLSCFAQNWHLFRKVDLSGIDQYSVDQQGNIYISNLSGDILKYDKNGKQMQEYSPETQGRCSQIDAISSLKVLVFYEEYQEYLMLDRYLSNAVRYRLANIDFGYISHVSLTMLQSVWMVDASDFSLKLWNTLSSTLEENKSLAKVLTEGEADISGLYTYQNRTYLIDRRSGIYVFDIIGNFMRFIEVKGLSNINFMNDKLYYKLGSDIHLLSLYEDDSVKINLPKGTGDKILYSGGLLYHFTESELEIYSYLSAD